MCEQTASVIVMISMQRALNQDPPRVWHHVLTGCVLDAEGSRVSSQLLQLTHAANEDLSIGLVALQQSSPTQGMHRAGTHRCAVSIWRATCTPLVDAPDDLRLLVQSIDACALI